MAGIQNRSKFSSTEFNYAFDFSTFRVGQNYVEVQALWFKKISGDWAVFSGRVSTYTHGIKIENIADFLEKYDGKGYGGNTEFKWDGSSMWSNDNANKFLPMLDAYNKLDPILKEFERTFEASKLKGAIIKNSPSVPVGYNGWYAIKPKN